MPLPAVTAVQVWPSSLQEKPRSQRWAHVPPKHKSPRRQLSKSVQASPSAPGPAGKQPAAIDPQSSDRSSPADEATAVDDTRADESETEASSAPQPEEASGDEPDKVVSRTAWRTFTTAPPRLVVQP
jgi:hypothetical protein